MRWALTIPDMGDLFSAPVMVVTQARWAKMGFEVTDEAGQPLASAQQTGGLQRNALERFMASGNDNSRVLVQVAAPDGRPLFLLDRNLRPPGVLKPPVAVVSPDNRLLGWMVHDRQAFAKTFLRNVMTQATHPYVLLDAWNRPVGRMESDVEWLGATGWVGGHVYAVTDLNGQQVARCEQSYHQSRKSTLRIFAPLPDPLRLLTVAAPIMLELVDQASGSG